ncbi:30S ribosomal protein S8e [Candidatus Woesearchaeota archaeon]|nr:30S ribosomal protein S8e [Candidatus Woesearchaeota archaeon]
MVISHAKSLRKPSGGRFKIFRKKRQYETGSLPTFPRPGVTKLNVLKTMGGNIKVKSLSVEFANVIDPKTKKAFKAKIQIVTDNPANRFFIRRNILTKGAIIQTDKGKAKYQRRVFSPLLLFNNCDNRKVLYVVLADVVVR